MTGMTKQQYVEFIKMELGGSVLEIENEDDIPKILDLAFNEVRNYITDYATVTLPYAKVIDLNQYKDKGLEIANIHYVMRARNQNGFNGFSDVMYIYRSNAMTSYSLTDYARALLVQQNKNALATDMDFHFDKLQNKLYIYCHQSLPAAVTLMYTPFYKDVSEITEPFWQNLIRRLALAYTKEVLGRIRSKYKNNSAGYTLDGDTLLSEAQNELQQIREYLNANSDIVFPMD